MQLLETRRELSLLGSLALGAALVTIKPFPTEEWVFQLILERKPQVFYTLSALYAVMCFTSTFFVLSSALSLMYVFLPRLRRKRVTIRLPQAPQSSGLSLVVGEVHKQRTAEPIEDPNWLVIPERGLFTGVAVIGAIGSGKTSCCMYPFAEQILSFGSPDTRIGGLVLEVKGDFCHKVRGILEKQGRIDDYVEINLTDSPYRYNPLKNDLDAYSVAYGIATMISSLFGKGREPFWQQGYTNMMKFIILLHRVLYDYVTFFEIYECAINPDLLKARIELGELAMNPSKLVEVDPAIYVEFEELARFKWERNESTGQMLSPLTEELSTVLLDQTILHQVVEADESVLGVKPIRDPIKRAQFEAVRRWFNEDWMRIDPRLRTSLVEGIAFFLSLFDDNPTLRRIFCPPKECFDPVANADGRFGTPLLPFSEVIESGKVVALNFPASENPGLARMIGTMMKVDFQRAVLSRVPKMEERPNDFYRQVLFLCDEYHAFATVGDGDPTGDEKFFSLSRQSKCLAIVATQSISSLRSVIPGEAWRTLLQTFRTKIFLSLADDFTARVASDLCGRDEQLKLSYNFSETGQDTQVSLLTGHSSAQKSSVTASKSYSLQKDNIFEARVFSELKNAQAIVLAYDGFNPLPPTYCFLKPYFLDSSVSYFEHLNRGAL